MIQDFGYIEGGENYSCSVTVDSAARDIIGDYCKNRTPVTVRDVGGLLIENMRVIIKRYGYVERYEDKYAWAKIEFWRNK